MKSTTILAGVVALCSGSSLAGQISPPDVPHQAPKTGFDSGPIPITLSPTQLAIINVKLNGVETPALLDTGSSTILLDRKFASEHSFQETGSATSDAGGGRIGVGLLPDVQLTIGRADLGHVRARTADFSALNAVRNVGVSVFVGMSAVETGSLDLSFRRMMMQVSSRPPSDTSGLKSYSLSAVSGIPVISVPLNGRTTRVALDTGKDSDIAVTDATFEALKSPGDLETTLASGGVGGISIARLSVKPTLDFGGVLARNVAVESEQLGGLTARLGVDAIAGLRLIRRLDLKLDFVAGRAYVGPSGVTLPALVKSTSGLQLAYGSSARVAHVMANSPAAALGWKIGDQICQINGHSILEVRDSPSLRVWGSGISGTKVTFDMCSGDKRDLILKTFY